MRNTIRLVGFVSLIAIPGLTILHLILPPLWGSPSLALKYQCVTKTAPGYDRVFLGSSRIFRQLDPRKVDSLLHDGGRSFNMAVAASFPPETYQLCEQLLLERKVPVKDIYIELASLMLFEEKNLAHFRYWYHLSASNAYKLVRHAWWLPGKKRGQRAGYVLRASRAYCNSLFAPGLADHLIESTTGVDTMNTLGPGLNGFVPLDWQLAHDTGNAELIERREEFRLQPLAGHQRAAYINSLYEGNRDAGISEVHRALLEHLMVLGDEQGVNVHFILPPLWVDQGEDLVALFRSLPMERRFDLCDPKRFPEFYLPENMFDMGHLNTKGAEVFSLRVAAAIKASGQEDRGSSMDNP